MKNEKKIEDYLHLYLGCEVLWQENRKALPYKLKLTAEILDHITDGGSWKEYKLILYPISLMKEQEFNHMIALGWVGANSAKHWRQLPSSLSYQPEQFLYLLSKHFDLFDLINSGLAIDKTTHNP